MTPSTPPTPPSVPAFTPAMKHSPAPPNVTVSITFPAAWLTPIYNAAEDALHGHDLYWMKQLMAKIAIAAAHNSAAQTKPALSGAAGREGKK